MKNYEDMSDFEINKAVMEIELRGQLIEYREQEIDELADILGFDGRSSVVRFTTQLGSEQSFEGCNNPSDAWPIIIGNKINIEWRDSLKVPPLAKGTGGNQCWHADKNPLRAAMICFLKMNDGLEL